LLERVPLVAENEATRFAAKIGRWLAGHVKEKKLPFTVRVTAEREPNALALTGGPVFVSWPLLEMCQGQRDEIAFVLGHEMAHIVRRHTLNRIVKDAALSLLLRQLSGRRGASAWLSKAGGQLLRSAFSRDETEADIFAVTRGEPLAGTHWQRSACWRNCARDPGGASARRRYWPPPPCQANRQLRARSRVIRPILGASAAQATMKACNRLTGISTGRLR
jgi:hypothetical protein